MFSLVFSSKSYLNYFLYTRMVPIYLNTFIYTMGRLYGGCHVFVQCPKLDKLNTTDN